MSKPLAIDLFCGLGGWTEGLLAEGYNVVGFDMERHHYGDAKYPAQLVIQDVLTIHGKQFKDAALIVASPPCQEYSYMAMPWSRAKAIAADYRSGKRDTKQLTALFDACFRIQDEASAAAGHHIPMVVENVRGAIPWVGRSRWNFGSFHLWGDVPALMPIPLNRHAKMSGFNMSGDPDKRWGSHHLSPSSDRFAELVGHKNTGGSWFNIGSPGQKEVGRNPVHEGAKNPGFRFDGSGRSFQTASVEGVKMGRAPRIDGVTRRLTNPGEWKNGGDWFGSGADCSLQRRAGSKSNARKAASAMIAKIPFVLSQHIAKVYHP